MVILKNIRYNCVVKIVIVRDWNIMNINYTQVIKKQTQIIALSVFVMVIGILGVSYALFMKVDQSEEQTVQSGSLIMQLSAYDGSTVITDNNTPIDDNEGLLSKGYSFSVTNNGTLPITYYIALYDNPDDTSTNKVNYDYIKVSLDNGTPFTLGSITTKDSAGRYILKQDISLAPSKYDTHNIKIWLDEDTPESEIGKTISLKIYAYGEVCEDGECNGGTSLPATEIFKNLSINDTTSFASDDPGNNIRYIGADPNNYIYFNCSDYSNQSDSTCEKWRIIGLFNNVIKEDGTKSNLIKIIRNDSLGSYFIDYKQKGVASSVSNDGSNDWTDSQLMMMFNPIDYLKRGYTNSSDIISYNGQEIYSKMGSYYNGTKGCAPASVTSGSKFTCNETDFTATGLKNDTTRNAIESVVWNLGGASDYQTNDNGLASNFYAYERGTDVYSGRPTTWIGKIGLMYPSDYGYATSGGSTTNRDTCLATALYSWSGRAVSDCKTNDYLYKSGSEWTMTPYAKADLNSFLMYLNGNIHRNGNYIADNVRPTLYLKADISFESGNGTVSSPYKLSL